jgi:hypothetical protein
MPNFLNLPQFPIYLKKSKNSYQFGSALSVDLEIRACEHVQPPPLSLAFSFAFDHLLQSETVLHLLRDQPTQDDNNNSQSLLRSI